MKVVFLGTGTLEPHPDRASSALAVVEEEDELFVDFGRNALNRSVECGLNVLSAPDLLLTHIHPDHCCEMVSLLFARNYADGYAASSVAEARTRARPSLRISGPPGTAELVRALTAAWRWLDPQYDLEVCELEDGWVGQRAGFEVEAVAVHHGRLPALGYRISRGGRSLAFTGDTGPGPALRRLAKGVDLLICECGRRCRDQAPVHLGPDDVGEIARIAQCHRVVLTHFYAETDPLPALAEVRQRCDCEVSLARDRMEIALD